ncbi:MAG: NRDE family protein [Flavobacteriales bacterium]
MCLIVFAYRTHPRFPLIVVANRDEFLARPTAPASFWDDAPDILAGRDLCAGGTWLGVTRQGRFAALTNYRDLRKPRPKNAPSRGELVVRALKGEMDPEETRRYDGFNVLFGTADDLRYHNNINGAFALVEPGIHGLSNHLLNTPWPKVTSTKHAFTKAIERDRPDVDALFGILKDGHVAADEQLPDTGLDIVRERALSAAFIVTEGYGTRCSTVVLVDHDGRVHFEERTWQPLGTAQHTFTITT